ncbi:MAG: hypothetical protein K9L78_03795 [Victivallales bacterium]|nr:hypothetical protein [Victivallales bacterium]MCF7889223.1 hypothetical protein [Victivallales bacterium]
MKHNKLLIFFSACIISGLLIHGYIIRQGYMFKTISKKAGSSSVNKVFLVQDPNAFYNYAVLLPYPCFTISRPPFFLIYTKSILKLFGHIKAGTLEQARALKNKINSKEIQEKFKKIFLNHLLLRENGIFLNLFFIVFTALFMYRLFGSFPAIISTALSSFNFYNIFYSVMYFRVDMLAILNLTALLLFCVLLKKSKHKFLTVSALIIILSAASLARLSTLSTAFLSVLCFNLIKFFYNKWDIRVAGVSGILLLGTFILVSPYLIYCYNQTGTPAPVMNHHAKFWRNHEFAGKPGYPSVAEVAENPYCGPETTGFKYVFKDHSLPGVITQYAKGYWFSFTEYLPEMFCFYIFGKKYNLWWLLLFAFPGIICCFRKREEGIMLLFFSITVLFPFAFILPLNEIFSPNPADNVIGVEPRFNMPILPYAIMLSALGINFCFHSIYSTLKPGKNNNGVKTIMNRKSSSIS